jgi:hypothetical protein
MSYGLLADCCSALAWYASTPRFSTSDIDRPVIRVSRISAFSVSSSNRTDRVPIVDPVQMYYESYYNTPMAAVMQA